jgi:hypothetical protein
MNGRLERTERNVENMSAQMLELLNSHIGTVASQKDLIASQKDLVASQKELVAKMVELADGQKHTDDRIDALADIVRQLIERNGNGGSQPN